MRSYCPDNFHSPGFDIRPSPGPPPNMIFFHILGLNINFFYEIASLFDMYIDMGERAGKQDRPSPVIEDPPQGPTNSQKYIFFYILAHI